jgi:hypothetical protein
MRLLGNSLQSSAHCKANLENSRNNESDQMSKNHSAKLTTSKNRKLRAISLLILLPLFASGCTSTEQIALETETAKLVQTCAKIKGSLRKTTNHFDKSGMFHDLQFGDRWSKMSLLAGVEERNNWEKLIIEEYPYLNSIKAGRGYEGSGMGAVFLLLDATADTQFAQNLDSSDLKSLEKAIRKNLFDSSGSVATSRSGLKEFDNLITSTIGSFQEEPALGCAKVDENHNTYRVFQDALDVINTLEETVWAIRTCRQLGDKWNLKLPYGSNDCARESYELKDDNSGPIILDNPWEREWTDNWSEQTAKFAYCWDLQMIYSESLDACIN